MPYKSEKILIRGTQYDRRNKLTAEQRQEIFHRYHTESVSQRQLACEYGVSRRLISYIVDPEKAEIAKEILRQRKAKGMYKPDKKQWAAVIREHRRYKQQLYIQGLIQLPQNMPDPSIHKTRQLKKTDYANTPGTVR